MPCIGLCVVVYKPNFSYEKTDFDPHSRLSEDPVSRSRDTWENDTWRGVPIPSDLFGIFLSGDRSVRYHEGESPRHPSHIPMSSVESRRIRSRTGTKRLTILHLNGIVCQRRSRLIDEVFFYNHYPRRFT